MDRVIKAEQGRSWAGRRIAAEVWQAGETARAVVASAQAEAAALRREALEALEAELGALRRSARAAAEAEGREAGRAAAATTLVRAAAERDRWLESARGEALDLAVEMARRILARELALAPGAVRGAAQEALRAARGRRRLRLRVHPAGAAALRDGQGDGLAGGLGPAVAVEADPSLSPGDVVLETEAGTVDARVETRLAAFRAALEAAAP